MTESDTLSRRTLVTSAAVLLTATGLAGCADSDTGDSTPTGDSGSTPDTATPTPTMPDTTTESDGSESTPSTETSPTATDTDSGLARLDQREANVTDVVFERQNGDVTFDVTLFHDDDGEDGYANWWQVERPNGDQLGRRELLHAHSRQPFTRSDTISVPDGVSCVVVRGHDQTHGYGGQVMLVNLDTGTTRAVDQGQEPQSFTESDCPS